MKVSCQACGAKYTISDEKVRGRKVKIRCKSCGTPIVVDGANPAEAPGDAAPAAAVSEAPPSVAPAAGGDATWSVNLSETDQRTMTTTEIVAGWKDGTVTHDAFVWKDGMGDWVAIGECADLKGLLPGAAAVTGTPFGPTVVTAPTPARLSGGRAGAGVDLFDAAAPGEEDDIATSAPHLPAAGTSAYDDGKMTGARNENSVLFSLDSLKGGLAGQAPAAKKPEPKRPGVTAAAATSADPFAMSPTDIGGNPLFSLNANQALLTAPAPPEPPPPRVEATGGAPAKPMNKLLVYGGGGAAAVILLLVGLLIGRTGGGETPAGDSSAKALASAEPEKKDEPKKEDKKDDDEKKSEAAAPATGSPAPSAAPSSAPAKVAVATGSTPSTGTKKSDAADTKKPDAETMPAAGGSPFSVSAAQVALTQAASNAAGCGKPGGPTGSGKAQVTFAPSGRVTTANVSTPPFAGTAVGGCVAGVFRRARVPAFSGNPVTVSKSFSVK